MQSFIASFAVRAGRGLTSAQKAVLFALAAHCQKGTNMAFPGMDTLAEEAGLTRTGAQGVVKQLEKLGWLKVKRQKLEKNRDAPNEYRIIPPWGMTNKPPKGWVNGIGPEGQPDWPSLGQADGHEVKRLSEVKKEATKSLLTTLGRLEGQTKHPAAILAHWLKTAGTADVDVASLDRSGERTSLRQIKPGDARNENAAHCCIFIRPVRGDAQPCIMLDDLDSSAAADVSSRWRSAVVETSENNFQVWVATSRTMTEDERKRVQRIVGAGYGADKGSNSGDHYGRCPGFKNYKSGRNGFVSRLIQAADRGKLLDVDAVLRQEPAAPRYRPASRDLPAPRRAAARSVHIGGDVSESGSEWGWVMGSLESGMSPTEVQARLTDHAERRGKDASRYATRTVRTALKKVSARA